MLKLTNDEIEEMYRQKCEGMKYSEIAELHLMSGASVKKYLERFEYNHRTKHIAEYIKSQVNAI